MHDDVLGNDSDILAIKNFIGFDSATSSSGSLTGQISGNDSDIAALSDKVGINDSAASTESLQAQITANDSDIAALNASLNTSIGTVNANNVRTVNLAILRSNGTVVKRIFGYTDSGV